MDYKILLGQHQADRVPLLNVAMVMAQQDAMLDGVIVSEGSGSSFPYASNVWLS